MNLSHKKKAQKQRESGELREEEEEEEEEKMMNWMKPHSNPTRTTIRVVIDQYLKT
jgi:hypothetical protein